MVETHPGQLRQWAATLPFTNPDQLIEAVLTSLGRLNRFPAAVKKRDELMEIYRIPCSRLYHIAHERSTSPSPKLQRRLMLEMAYGHLHLVNQSIGEKASARQRGLLRTYLYFAAKYLTLEYLLACQMYDCRGSMPLRETLRLHTLAEEQELQDEPVDDPEQPGCSIAHHTKLLLLLSLLDPCHLQQGEPRIVYDYLTEFADLASFVTLESLPEPAGHYVIDRLGEVPPHRFEAGGGNGLNWPRFCLFNLIPISQQLHQDLRMIEKQGGSNPPGLQHLGIKAATNLLRRMLKSWHIRLERDSKRHTTSGRAKIWLGVQAVHRCLSETDDAPASDDPQTGQIAVDLDTGGLAPGADRSEPVLECWRFNQSRSGVALWLSLPLATPPQVGELVLLSKDGTGAGSEAKIGIVRRALLKDSTILEIGVQFMNGRIVPLTLQASAAADEPQTPIIPALYIDLGDIERGSLLAAKDSLAIGREYRVEEMIPSPDISPVHLLEVTALFERFRIRRA